MSTPMNHDDVERFLRRLARISQLKRPPITDENALEWLASNWQNCADGLLKKTTRIRVTPEDSPAPLSFSFEIDTPFKRKIGDGPVELVTDTPVRGELMYRSDFYEEPVGPTVAVRLDPSLGYFHPNLNRTTSFLCWGDESNFERGYLPLDGLLQSHLFPVISYQNRSQTHLFDEEAARYFALDPAAMEGLEPVQPLY